MLARRCRDWWLQLEREIEVIGSREAHAVKKERLTTVPIRGVIVVK